MHQFPPFFGHLKRFRTTKSDAKMKKGAKSDAKMRPEAGVASIVGNTAETAYLTRRRDQLG